MIASNVNPRVQGGELFDRIVKLHRYSEKDAAVLIHQIVCAISHLHEHNVVHRDLKVRYFASIPARFANEMKWMVVYLILAY